MKLILAALATAIATTPANKAVDWHAAAVGDVEAAYRLYRDNHPGWFDPANPGFKAQLEQARGDGLADANKARSYNDYVTALARFSADLGDGHAQVGIKKLDPSTVRWAGFTAAWRGKALYVAGGTPPTGISIGAKITSCDGEPIDQLIVRRLRTHGMRPREAGQWWFHAGRIFKDDPLSGQPAPAKCAFTGPNGAQVATLSWSPAPANLNDLLRAPAEGEKTPIGLSEPRPGIFLVGLPDFNPDAAGVAAYRTLFAELKSRHQELRRARAVILDLRWNNGGSSDWPEQTAAALWGSDVVDQRMADYFRNVRIWWRASPENLAYMSTMEAKIRGNGNVETADSIHQTAQGMKASLTAGKPFYVDSDDEAPSKSPPAKTDFATPVYVITPGGCASACLDAVDIFKRFSNVRLIGAPTSADSTYLEVRTVDLRSGQAFAVIPLKIWVGRPRAAGEVYTPDVEVDDLEWSTAEFLNAVERDLRRR